MNPASCDRMEEFVRLLGEHERRINLFIMSAVSNWDDAAEIRQEVNVALWRQFDKFEAGTDFGAWAVTIARYKVLSFWEQRNRERLEFDNEFLDCVAEEVERQNDLAEARRAALAECMKQLTSSGRELLTLCYLQGQKVKDAAQALGRTPAATYKMLERVRQELFHCVERAMEREDTQ